MYVSEFWIGYWLGVISVFIIAGINAAITNWRKKK